MHSIPAIRNCTCRLLDYTVDAPLGLIRPRRKRIGYCLKMRQQRVEGLQQSVVRSRAMRVRSLRRSSRRMLNCRSTCCSRRRWSPASTSRKVAIEKISASHRQDWINAFNAREGRYTWN